MPNIYIRLLLDWCRLKVRLAVFSHGVKFKQGEVWWCCIGMNVGEEIFGKGARFTRPVLVFRKFTTHSFLGLPLTRQNKEGSWYVAIMIQGKENRVMLNQARILDAKRMTNKISTLSDDEFKHVQYRFVDFYLSDNSHPALRAGISGKSQIVVT